MIQQLTQLTLLLNNHSMSILHAPPNNQVCEALTDALNINTNEHGLPPSFEVSIERRVKMFYIIPALILLKQVIATEKSIPICKLIQRRLNQWNYMEWKEMTESKICM